MTAATSPTGPVFPANSYEFVAYRDCANWIGGEWVPAQSGRSLPVDNPRHGQLLGHAPDSGQADVDAAVAAARSAFPAWRATPIKERVQVLYRLKAIMEANLEELTWLLSHENGKLFGESKAELEKGIECIEMGIACANMGSGEQMDVSRGVNCKVTYEPLGVVACIVPFNFPTMVPLWMLPQALVAGNTVVIKPSEKVPYGCMKLAHMLKAAGLPDGVFNIVNGGKETVEAIADHPDIKAIGFVGSTRIARLVYERGAATGKKVLALGGAKNHLVLLPDADFELATTNIPASAYGCAGQRCMAASVLLAVGSADPAGFDLNQNLARTGRGTGDALQSQIGRWSSSLDDDALCSGHRFVHPRFAFSRIAAATSSGASSCGKWPTSASSVTRA
jgi:malonate-semialdehyde dehydrogenase (acetylating)/methylmalonate-semialdehyde dehydrogenase